MKYRNRNDGSLTTKSQLIAANPNTSLPKTWTPATLDYLGVDPVLAGVQPPVGEFEIVVFNGVELVGGNWVEAWTVQPMFVDNDEATAVEQQAAYTAARLAEKRASMEITMRQCRLQLLAENKLAGVEAAIAALPAPDQASAQVEWEYAAKVNRISPLVAVMGAALLLNDEQVDAMFASAALL